MTPDITPQNAPKGAKADVNDMCIGCQLCTSIAPTVFTMIDGKSVAKKEDLTASELPLAKKAESDCPVAAISINE